MKTLRYLCAAASLWLLFIPSAVAQKARVQRTVWSDATQTAGTGDAITLAPSPALAALTDLDTVPPTLVCFVAESANTTTVTVAISGLTAKPIYKMNGAITTALAANDLRAGQTVCMVRYPTGDAFQMITQLGNAPSGGSSSVWQSPGTGTLATTTGAGDLAIVSMSSTLTFDHAGGAKGGPSIIMPNTQGASNEGFQLRWPTGSGFVTNGAVNVSVLFYASASGVLTFDIEPACQGAGAGITYGSAQQISVNATGSQFNIASGAITLNCAAGQLLQYWVTRNQSDANSGGAYVTGAWGNQ